MKYILIILALLLTACGEGKYSTIGDPVVRELWEVSDQLVATKNTAGGRLKQATAKHYHDKAKLNEILKINKETVDCTYQSKLTDKKKSEAFFAELNRADRVKPDSEFLKELTNHYDIVTQCYSAHNDRISPYL